MKMKKIFVVIAYIFFTNSLIAQSNAIIYSGGICFEGDLCGYWILKNNATFIYTKFDSIGLRAYGFGSWKISDNMLSVKFDSSENMIKPLMNYSINIKSNSDYLNKDSIKIKIKVVDKSNTKIPDVIVLINKNIIGKEDDSGNTFFVIPRKYSINMIRIKSAHFEATPLFTLPSNENNNHEILVVYDYKNPKYTELINDRYRTDLLDKNENANLNYQFKIEEPKKGRIHVFSVAKSEPNVEEIIHKLYMSKKSQAENYSSIDQILSIINQ